MITKRRDGETFESLLRRFTKSVEKGDIIKDYKRHLEYTAPSLKRKRKHQAELKRRAREAKKELRMQHRGLM